MKGWKIFFPERRKQELAEELETHMRMAVDDRIHQGQSPEEARAAVEREFGNLPLVEDVTRQQWGWLWLERLIEDLRYALLKLRKSPGYTTTVILTLTLAIGANTAIFGLIYALMLRSLPVEQPERLVQINMLLGPGKKGFMSGGQAYLSGTIFDAVAARQHDFSGMCAWSSGSLNFRDAEGTRPVNTAMVTGDCFRTLGIHAALGRLFTASEDTPGGGPEGYPIVLGYDYWRTRLGADPAILGRVLDFEGKKGVVVGVMERGFDGVKVGDRPSLYAPSKMEEDPGGWNYFGEYNRLTLARLNDGVTPVQAQSQIDAAFRVWLNANPPAPGTFSGDLKQFHLLVVPGRTGVSFLRLRYGKPLFLLEGLVGLSLLVACAYLAMLSSTRALARRRELALRISLGASRVRVVGQLCYESMLVALAGCALGVLFAWAASDLLLRLLPIWGSQAPALDVRPGIVVLLFSLGLTGLTVLLSGVGPALRASRLDPATDLKEGEQSVHGRRRHRVVSWLAPLQIAFSLVIVVIATLMSTTLVKLLTIDPGFKTDNVTFLMGDFDHRAKIDKSRLLPLKNAILERIRRAPGVEAASLAQTHPLEGSGYGYSAFSVLPSGETRKDDTLTTLDVAPEYFRTLGIPILAGRDFTVPAFAVPAENLPVKAAPSKEPPRDAGSEENISAPAVCILNRAAAEFFFPRGRALGGILTIPHRRGNRTMQVIAVVGDTRYYDLREAPPRVAYLPYFNGFSLHQSAEYAVRAKTPAMAISAVREAFRQLAPDVAVDEPDTLTEDVNRSVGQERLLATLASFFALLALALTAIGIYGLLNDAVARRRSEIGLRLALGASQASVARLVLGEAMRMVLPGMALGIAGACAATRLVRSFLYGVRPLDPWVFATSLALLALVAVIASLLPAWRAASVDPMRALRAE